MHDGRTNRRAFIAGLGGAAAWPLVARGQQPKKVYRIGFLANDPTIPTTSAGQAFLAGLRESGFVEGDNIVIERRFAEGMANRYPKLIAELIELNPDVLITSAIPATMAAKRATNSIPIVMLNVADPLKEGIIANLAHPSGNVGTIRNHGNYDQANSVTQRCDAERFKGWRFG
jgi:putative tryptophan/tyrosine transport system substrate-binding protein